MLSRSAIEGLCEVCLGLSSSFCQSVGSVAGDSIGGGEVGTFLGGSGGRAAMTLVRLRQALTYTPNPPKAMPPCPTAPCKGKVSFR